MSSLVPKLIPLIGLKEQKGCFTLFLWKKHCCYKMKGSKVRNRGPLSCGGAMLQTHGKYSTVETYFPLKYNSALGRELLQMALWSNPWCMTDSHSSPPLFGITDNMVLYAIYYCPGKSSKAKIWSMVSTECRLISHLTKLNSGPICTLRWLNKDLTCWDRWEFSGLAEFLWAVRIREPWHLISTLRLSALRIWIHAPTYSGFHTSKPAWN